MRSRKQKRDSLVDAGAVRRVKAAEGSVARSRNLAEHGLGDGRNQGPADPNDSNASEAPRGGDSGDGVVKGQRQRRSGLSQRRRFAAAFSILRVMYHC